ncbi:OLC1v1004641C1 [Oldenlandia corymbosa var. corymbosa]|uniref:RBR-type E3 ubiquitin transferase n=1 Tax=Oldenlandia corymbosa var. corymbosa TaxID=529605 RepID=A0AAV1DDI8_OLDCO|nr:OLC1v1004641C1 [Oldenlandia corymbosa var. corymbosa]
MGYKAKNKSKDKAKAASKGSHQDSSRSNPTVRQDRNPTNIPVQIHEDDDKYGYGLKSSKPGASAVESPDLNRKESDDSQPASSLPGVPESPDSNKKESNDGNPVASQTSVLELPNSHQKGISTSATQPSASPAAQSPDLIKKESNDPSPAASQPGGSSVLESPDLNKDGSYTSGNGAEEKKMEKETLISMEKKGVVEPNGTKCAICDIDKPTRYMKQAAKCGHQFCLGCFNNYVLGKIQEVLDPSVSCPNKECTEILSDDEILALLNPCTKTKWLLVQNYQGTKEIEAKVTALSSSARKCLSMIDNIP